MCKGQPDPNHVLQGGSLARAAEAACLQWREFGMCSWKDRALLLCREPFLFQPGPGDIGFEG